MINLTIEKLKAATIKIGGRWFENGDYNINFGAVRTSDVFTDTFTDIGYIAYKVKGQWVLKTFPYTTKPGSYGVKNPVTVEGVTGVAVLVEGFYPQAFTLVNSTSNKWGLPYLQQVKPLKIYRDADKDNQIDRGKVYDAPIWYGIFQHQMGLGNIIYNWSLGCQGAPKSIWTKIVIPELLKSKFGFTFSYTLLNINDLK